jgi:hypothetical protein
MKKHDKALTQEKLAAIKDNDISFSDTPELDASFWEKAERVEPTNAKNLTTTIRKPPLP